MPVKKCTSKGKTGHKYGDSGKCYSGSGSKEKAAKQGVAIRMSQQRSGKKMK